MIITQYKFALNKLALIFHLILPLILMFLSNALLATTQIYTIQELPFFDKEFDNEFDKKELQGKEPDVCYLDFTKKVLSKINREMDEDMNKKMNKQMNNETNTAINDEETDKILNKVLNKSLLEQLSDNLQCRFRAASSGITKVPAVVIDDKVVIYGVRSIKQAYELKERGNNG